MGGAAADQRRGRAGRTAPGVCYRLWEEAATLSLPAFAPAEILAADLSGFLLDLAAWGARDPKNLRWLDAPPAPAVAEAQILLRELGALDADNAITTLGKAMRRLPLPPRLASMVLRAENFGAGRAACLLALLLSERGLGGDTPDLAHRLDNFARDSSPRAKEAKKLADNWTRILREARDVACDAPTGPALDLSPGALVALAFPDRIARARGKFGDFLLANGRAASLEPEKPLAQAKMLAVAEIAGRAGASRILAAAELDEDSFETLFGHDIQSRDETFYDAPSGALRRRQSRRYGALTLGERNMAVEPTLENAQILSRGAAAYGLDRLNWSKAQRQTRDRVKFLREVFAREGASEAENPWPDFSEAALSKNVEDWLAPFILGVQKRDDIAPEHFSHALDALIPWDLARKLEAEAPTHFVTPAGSSIALDYDGADGPVLAARVQEFYGLSTHPALAGGRAPLTLHLLSPAHRPIQITRDLPGFWQGSWKDVRTEMKGRYPRHVWPEDPTAAAPTTRAKPPTRAKPRGS